MIIEPITKAEAIKSLNSNAEFAIRGNIIEWINTTPIDEALITAEVTRLQAEYDSKQYARDREAEYDQLNQFEMQFDDQLNGTTTWVDAINEIKARYPK